MDSSNLDQFSKNAEFFARESIKFLPGMQIVGYKKYKYDPLDDKKPFATPSQVARSGTLQIALFELFGRHRFVKRPNI